MFYPFEIDNTTNKIIIKHNLFTKEECNSIIEACNNLTKQEGVISTGSIIDSKVRKNKIAWFDNSKTLNNNDNKIIWAVDRIANHIYNANKEHYNFDLFGLTEAVQFTEYSEKKDHYDWHCDSSVNAAIRKLSIAVQLSDPKDYKGSKLEFWETRKDKDFPNNQGTAILFPSYMLHRVTPLLSGTRYSLVTWVGGPNFK
jgi:PKHD-type hydroxylase